MYFVYPFGTAGTTSAIPATASPDVLSYQYGFGVDFELPLNTNPSALPIPRAQFNKLMLDITSTLQGLYQYGTPPWITSAENLGAPFPYPISARVYYLGKVYESQVAANTATPGADDSWQQISASFSSVQAGTIIDFAGIVPTATSQPGYLKCDGASYSRSTYPDLFAALTYVQSGTTTGAFTITGLSNMFAIAFPGMRVEGTNITPGTTIASVDSNTQITLDTVTGGAGTNPVTFIPWGAVGTSVFSVPNLQDQVTAGVGGTLFQTGSVGNAVGADGGATGTVMNQSNLPGVISAGVTINTKNVTTGAGVDSTEGIFGPGTPTASVINLGGSSSPLSIVQPTTLVNKLIKY